jgi:signal transduction histidine kinase/ActR/RegA family two-component response regulator
VAAPLLPVNDFDIDDPDAMLADARDDVRKFWERLPAVVVVSFFLFEYIGPRTGAAWLGCILILEISGYLLNLQILRGSKRLRWAALANTFAISLCWVAHAAILWNVGVIVPQIAAIMGIFSVSLYAVTSSYRNRTNMLALLLPPLITLCLILTQYLWVNSSILTAIFGSLSTIGVAALIVMNGFAMSKAFHAERLSAIMLKASEKKYRAAAQRAEAASIAKSEFLANVSHELRTPLTCIIGFSDLLSEDRTLGARTKDFALRIQDGGRSLLATINDVLDYSEMGHGALAIFPAPTRVFDVAEEVISLLAFQAKDRGNTVTLVCSPHLMKIECMVDPVRFRQVLLNLIGNAIKFTENGHVKVTLDLVSAQLKCEVSDTGVGIKSEDADKLFQRFSQVDNSLTRKHGGTGLGLAICKGILDAANGSIGLFSTEGKGSTFWFEMPAPMASINSTATSSPSDSNTLSHASVLVVDDNEATRNFVQLAMRSLGATCVEAESGENAVSLAADQTFDLIMMDLRMPGMGGHAAMQAIRSQEAGKSCRIVAFTGEADSEQLSALIGQGFDGVLRKPVTIQNLKDFLMQHGFAQ